VLADGRVISYSDGAASEAYLREVFGRANDLSSTSVELEGWIKDWPSEYHLSRKRSQLLRGFDFKRSHRVLEVGCGCGAITRFLGETFDSVTAVEGSLARAKLARMRTRDLPGVSVVCAPFQELTFQGQFDVVFCIGVLEYSGSFVKARDPYDAFLERMAAALKPDGILVLAIENQFGLKYFCTSTEDHTNRMFEGVEGYPRFGSKVQTFGYGELRDRISRHFHGVKFLFPYPDYKLPEAVLTEEFLSLPNAAQVVAHAPSRDYGYPLAPLFDEKSAAIAIGKNGQLPFFANSFLVYAQKGDVLPVPFNGLGLMFSDDRPPHLSVMTHFVNGPSGEVLVTKTQMPGTFASVDSCPVRFLESSVAWEYGPSLEMELHAEIARASVSGDVFSLCSAWLASLREVASQSGDGCLPGRFLDAIWQNAFLTPSGCRFIDLEWEWHRSIRLEILVIRAFYVFLANLSDVQRSHVYAGRLSTQGLIVDAARSLGVPLQSCDFADFVQLESELCASVSRRVSRRVAGLQIRAFLASRLALPVFAFVRGAVVFWGYHSGRIKRGIARIAGR
jgi:2-polyprenyl-3-methyl-5-hydroxy-6-metoxy-1,4-benzoquinol methylase